MKASRVTFLLFLLAGLASIAMGDTRTYKEYLYDEAGNIIGIRTDVTQSPPIITDLTPSVAVARKITVVLFPKLFIIRFS